MLMKSNTSFNQEMPAIWIKTNFQAGTWFTYHDESFVVFIIIWRKITLIKRISHKESRSFVKFVKIENKVHFNYMRVLESMQYACATWARDKAVTSESSLVELSLPHTHTHFTSFVAHTNIAHATRIICQESVREREWSKCRHRICIHKRRQIETNEWTNE